MTIPTLYTVVLTYLDGEQIELAGSPDRAAMHELAERVACHAAPQLDAVSVVAAVGEPDLTVTWTGLHGGDTEADAPDIGSNCLL